MMIMTDLMENLYEFLIRQRVDALLANTEYPDFAACQALQEEKLRAVLDEDGKKHLDSMLLELSNQHTAELEAVFQASLVLCRELSGLVTP